MPVSLPSWPLPASTTMRQMVFGNDLTPTMGGPTMRIQRLGSRFSMEVAMPMMSYDDARTWIAAFLRSDTETVVMDVPQKGLDVGYPGSPVVDGNGQLGMFLTLRGLTPGYALQTGQFFSLIVSGQRFLYSVLEDVTANAQGKARIHFWPMMRRQPQDGDVLEIAQPKIEGFAAKGGFEWSIDAAQHTGLEFKIDERE